MRVAKRELSIFDDIRSDASDKSVARFAISGALPFTRAYILRDRSLPVTHPARVILYLCPDDFFARSIVIFTRRFPRFPPLARYPVGTGGVITSPGCRE